MDIRAGCNRSGFDDQRHPVDHPKALIPLALVPEQDIPVIRLVTEKRAPFSTGRRAASHRYSGNGCQADTEMPQKIHMFTCYLKLPEGISRPYRPCGHNWPQIAPAAQRVRHWLRHSRC